MATRAQPPVRTFVDGERFDDQDAVDKINESFSGLPVNRIRHAKIKQTNHVVRQDENIPRMRVGVEKTVLEHLS